MHKNYPTADEMTQDQKKLVHFLRGLNDLTLAVAVGMKDPKSIADAREMVETYNRVQDNVGRNQKVHSVSFLDNSNQKDPKSKWSVASDTKERHVSLSRKLNR